jgi:hypothetical protein
VLKVQENCGRKRKRMSARIRGNVLRKVLGHIGAHAATAKS